MNAATANFKIPPFGYTPRFGDLLNSRHVYEVEVGGGWSIKVDANDPEQATNIASREGYTPRRIRPIGDDE